MYANILLSTDGSDVARKGVQHGIGLAKALNAKATVITVTEPFPVDYGSGHASGWIPTQQEVDSFDAAWKERAGKVLDEARAMAEQIRMSVELLHVPNAHPATTIIETAKSRGCDLIVMGSHGRRGFRKRKPLRSSHAAPFDPHRFGDADHGFVEVAAPQHRLQRGKDLLVSEITRCAEKHQRVRPRLAHADPVLSPPDFSRCPPNS